MINNKTNIALVIFNDKTNTIDPPKYMKEAIDYITPQNGAEK